MDACELYDAWDSMTVDERIDAIGDLVSDFLDSWGMDDVDVYSGTSDPYTPAEYDPATVSIGINPGAVDGSDENFGEHGPWSAQDAAYYAAHEAMHAAQHQMGIDSSEFEAYAYGDMESTDFFSGCEPEPDSRP